MGAQEPLSGRAGSARHPWSGPCRGPAEASGAVGTGCEAQLTQWLPPDPRLLTPFSGSIRLEKTPEIIESDLLLFYSATCLPATAKCSLFPLFPVTVKLLGLGLA